MFPSLARLLRMRCYGSSRALRFISSFQFFISILLVFLPLYLNFLIGKIDIPIPFGVNVAIDLLKYSISALSAINILREYLLSKTEIVSVNFTKTLVRQLLMLLVDRYGWKGTCRATLFIPKDSKSEKIIVYDRISTGKGAGYDGNCFFTMGQGLPGIAWKNAWSGEGTQKLIKALCFGNVPDSTLKDKNDLRKFFRDVFKITNEKIYESLGPKKMEIKSYMAVGILGKFSELGCILVIDSEDENKFTDFEQLQKAQRGTFREEVAIIGRGTASSGEEKSNDDVSDTKGTEQHMAIPKEVFSMINKLEKSSEWSEIKNTMQEIGFLFHKEHSTDLKVNAEGFLFPLSWTLKQIRDIFIIENKKGS